MKKLLLLCLAVMCTLAFGLGGCDDEDDGKVEAPNCVEQCATYDTCVEDNCTAGRGISCEGSCALDVNPACLPCPSTK